MPVINEVYTKRIRKNNLKRNFLFSTHKWKRKGRDSKENYCVPLRILIATSDY